MSKRVLTASRLETEVCGLRMKNPILVAPTSTTRNAEYMRRAFESGAGGVVAKSVCDDPHYREGLTRPKYTTLHRRGYPHCFTNYSSAGAADYTPEEWVKEVKQAVVYAKEYGGILVGSIIGTSLGKWAEMAKMHEEAGVDMLEVNFGSPVVLTVLHSGGQDLCYDIVHSVVKAIKIPVFVKLTFEEMEPIEVAKKVKEAGAHGVTVINRAKGLEIDLKARRPLLAGGFSGVGGPWMRPIMLKFVARIASEVGLPISATNGIWTWEDVVKAIMCGATTVQTASAITHGRKGFGIVQDFIRGLEKYLIENDFPSVESLRGVVLKEIKGKGQTEQIEKGEIWAEVVPSKCNACGLCLNWCFYDAISKDGGGKVVVDKELCDGCALCISLCPTRAIEMRGRLVYLGDLR